MDANAIEMLCDLERRTRNYTRVGNGVCKADVLPGKDRREPADVGRRVGVRRPKRRRDEGRGEQRRAKTSGHTSPSQ
jgi:hypothetical protein